NSSNITTTTQTVNNIGPSASVGSTNTGNGNTLTCTNGSNTASSSAKIICSVAGATAGDASFQATVAGVTDWSWGIDNSDSDAWVLANTGTLGTGNVIRAATAGQITLPLQPRFAAYVNSNINNVTGNGTQYVIIANW